MQLTPQPVLEAETGMGGREQLPTSVPACLMHVQHRHHHPADSLPDDTADRQLMGHGSAHTHRLHPAAASLLRTISLAPDACRKAVLP